MRSNHILILLLSVMAAFVVIYRANQLFLPSNTNVIEIREYQGERLSSINAFRENSIRGPPTINLTKYRLRITGLVENPIEYTFDEVVNDFSSIEKVVTLNCVEGWSAKILWEGASIMDLVEAAGPMDAAETMIFHAEDGYTTSLPLDYVEDKNLILAYKINGVTLPKENGFPFQLVAESKWGYKWCRWVVELEFSDEVDYEGYWESRGYSNDGDLDKSFWDR